MLKKGYENKAAGALPRVTVPEQQEVLALSQLQPVWLQHIIEGCSTVPELEELLAALSVSTPIGHFSLKQGLIRYKNRIWLAHNTTAQQNVIQALHASSVGGHSGTHATYVKIKNLFAWPGLKKMVQAFVTQCSICQQAKLAAAPPCP